MVQYDYIYNDSHGEEEAAALREQIIQDYVKPLFEACIYKYPMLLSAVLLVAQYFDDEAHDAVHHKFFVSMLETPDLKAIFESYNKVRPTKRKERKTGKYKNRRIEDDPVNLPGLSGHVEVLLAGQEKFYARYKLSDWLG